MTSKFLQYDDFFKCNVKLHRMTLITALYVIKGTKIQQIIPHTFFFVICRLTELLLTDVAEE